MTIQRILLKLHVFFLFSDPVFFSCVTIIAKYSGMSPWKPCNICIMFAVMVHVSCNTFNCNTCNCKSWCKYPLLTTVNLSVSLLCHPRCLVHRLIHPHLKIIRKNYKLLPHVLKKSWVIVFACISCGQRYVSITVISVRMLLKKRAKFSRENYFISWTWNFFKFLKDTVLF